MPATSDSVAHAYCRYVRSAVHACPERGMPDHETVHAIRKDLKRARAALQLLRPRLSPSQYELQKHCIKDLADALAGVRDAKVAADTLDRLPVPATGHADGGVQSLRRRLHDERDLPGGSALPHDLVSPRRKLLRAAERIDDSDLCVSARILSREIRKSYRHTRRDIRAAGRRPTAAKLHHLRKRVTRLKHQLEMLKVAPRLQRKLQSISDLLGSDHDLWLLRQTVRAHAGTRGGHTKAADCRQLERTIRRRRRDLQKRALTIGAATFERRTRSLEVRND